MSLTQQLLLVPVLIALNAFFVAAEYAVVAIRPGQIEDLRRRRWTRTVASIERLKGNPARAIGAIQICITMTNLLIGWIAEPAMTQVLQLIFAPLVKLAPALMTVLSTAAGFIIVTLLTVVLSELLPKALTLRFAAAAAMLTAFIVVQLQRIMLPLVWVMTKLANAVIKPLGLGSVEQLEEQNISIEELRLLADQAAQSGVLSPRERSLILSGLTLGRRRAKEIMVHRLEVQWIDVEKSMDDNKRVVDSVLHTRFPLCDGSLDRIIGVVSAKEFLTAHAAGGVSAMLRLIASKPIFVPMTISLDQLLKAFHENRAEMLMLVSEYGSVEGIVTRRDVMDELMTEAMAT